MFNTFVVLYCYWELFMISQEKLDKLNYTFYKEAKELAINNYKCVCKFCGNNGFYSDSKCSKCGKEDIEVRENLEILKDLINRYDKVYSYLDIKDIKENDFLNLIASLDYHFVNAFLEKHNYKEKYQTIKDNISIKIDNFTDDFNSKDIHVIENEVSKNDSNIDPVQSFYCFCRKSLLKEQIINYETFECLFKKYIESYNPENINRSFPVKCIILGSDEYINNPKEHAVKIDSYLLKQLYIGSSFKALVKAYHEIAHIDQYYLKKYDPLAINNIKDDYLCELIPNYYNDNYSNIYSEVEANYLGFWHTILTIENKMNLRFNTKVKRMQRDIIMEYQDHFQNKKRIVNGVEYDIDEIFNKKIHERPEVLEKYPPLNYLYVKKSNKVFHKTLDELQEDSQMLDSVPIINEMFRKRVKALYNLYLKNNIISEPYMPSRFQKI